MHNKYFKTNTRLNVGERANDAFGIKPRQAIAYNKSKNS